MKKFITIIALFLLVAFGCEIKAQDYNGVVMVRSNTMTEVNDTLNLSFDIWVKRTSLPDYAAMRLVPKVVAQDNFHVFPDVIIHGSNKQKTYNRWLRTMGRKARTEYKPPHTLLRATDNLDTLLSFNYNIPYQVWMDDAVLTFDQELISYNDARSLAVFVLDGKVKLSARVPYQVQAKVNFIEPAAEQKIRNRQGQAFLDFQVAKSEIIPSYRRNPVELAKIQTAFAEIEGNDDVQINGLFIEGYASPEGRSEINERLSRDRAESLKRYIMNNFKLSLREEQIKVTSGGEDWQGLTVLLESSNIAAKDQVIEIINNEGNIARRKQRIQAINRGLTYRTMLNELYPQLRKVEYQIDFTVRDFETDQAKDLVGRNPELLSHRELYLAAMSYGQGTDMFDNIVLDIIPKQFTNDPVSQINAAAIMIERGELVAARRILERHAANPLSWNNLGVVELLAGELEKAEVLFNRSAAIGVNQAQVNLDELAKKRQDNEKMERFRNR